MRSPPPRGVARARRASRATPFARGGASALPLAAPGGHGGHGGSRWITVDHGGSRWITVDHGGSWWIMVDRG
eukprot:scaffold48142_cov36-Phaeocystis_antarctica.AAC.1